MLLLRGGRRKPPGTSRCGSLLRSLAADVRASDDVIAILKAVRRCAIDTVAQPSIYGNAFAMASPGRIQACTTVLNPPTASNNIYAIEAPPSGKGVYVVFTLYLGLTATP